MYDLEDIGPALQRLRLSRGLKQEDVARSVGLSGGPSISRLEKPGANPQASSLLRYLAAIDATFLDLHVELGGEIVQPDVEDEPEPPGRAAWLLERLAPSELTPQLRVLAELLDDHDRRLTVLERRLDWREE